MSEIIYGIHAIHTVLKADPLRFLDIYLLRDYKNKRLEILVNSLRQTGIVIQLVNYKYLNKKTKGAAHKGIAARIKKNKQLSEKDLPVILNSQTMPLFLVLDGITDPHNLGACLRCADATGVSAVIVPQNKNAPLNDIARVSASGAAETVPLIRVINLVRTLRLLQGYHIWIVGTDCNANNNLYKSKLTGPLAVVMGSEGKGLRRLTSQHCDELVYIPMAGTISALNVSVATGVFLFEIIRQRYYK